MDVSTAFVEVDGVQLFRVRGVSAFPAAVRSNAISKRISEAARDSNFDPNNMRLEETDLGLEIWGATVGSRSCSRRTRASSVSVYTRWRWLTS